MRHEIGKLPNGTSTSRQQLPTHFPPPCNQMPEVLSSRAGFLIEIL